VVSKPDTGSADTDGMKLRIEARRAGATINQREVRTLFSQNVLQLYHF
jgi:hypothetical protein